jgi:hypothetical protein
LIIERHTNTNKRHEFPFWEGAIFDLLGMKIKLVGIRKPELAFLLFLIYLNSPYKLILTVLPLRLRSQKFRNQNRT